MSWELRSGDHPIELPRVGDCVEGVLPGSINMQRLAVQQLTLLGVAAGIGEQSSIVACGAVEKPSAYKGCPGCTPQGPCVSGSGAMLRRRNQLKATSRTGGRPYRRPFADGIPSG